MNMIQQTFTCTMTINAHDGLPEIVQEFRVSAWMAMGSDNVNMRMCDEAGWIAGVETHKLSWYSQDGVRTMEEMVEFLFYVKS